MLSRAGLSGVRAGRWRLAVAKRGATRAIDVLTGAGVTFTVHEYAHDSSVASYGEEAAIALGLPADRVYKTLVVLLDGSRPAVAVVPVSRQLNLKAFAAALGAKRAELSAPADAERLTGYVVGGISPLGQRRRLPAVLDAGAQAFATIHVSAGRRGLEVELPPADLLLLAGAITAPIAV